MRNEVTKSRKVYFYDLGVRNSIIQNLNPLDMRDDTGALWENFCVLERLKSLEYNEMSANSYFWRTYDQKEIDYLEESGGTLKAFVFKWNSGKKVKEPKSFSRAYPGSSFTVVTPDSIEHFVNSQAG